MNMKTYRIAPLSNAAPDSVVIFLHGLGDCGSGGLLEIGRIWQELETILEEIVILTLKNKPLIMIKIEPLGIYG